MAKTATDDLTTDPGTEKTSANDPKDFKNLSEDEAVDAAIKGESVTTFGYDGAHMSSNSPIMTTGGVQGRDPLRDAIDDANNALPTLRVPAVEKGEKAPAPPTGLPKDAGADVVGEAKSVNLKYQTDRKRQVMIPADAHKGDYEGSINGAKFVVPRGEWVYLTDDQIHNVVASGEMPPPSPEFQASQNQLAPEVLIARQRKAGG